MRMRHTSRTDPQMKDGRKQVSYRLSSHYRDRIKDSVAKLKGTGVYIENESDIMQDAIWLWYYELDKIEGNGNGGSRSRAKEAGNRVDAGSGDGVQEAAQVEVGDPA
jgi:hypothetical protein